MPSKYEELRLTLQQLEAYELPEALKSPFSSQIDSIKDSQKNEKIVTRYQNARNDYLCQRTYQIFYEKLSHFNNGSLPATEIPTAAEQKLLTMMQKEAQENLEKTAASVQQKCLMLKTKYETFLHRCDTIRKIIEEMENSPDVCITDQVDKENVNCGKGNETIQEGDHLAAEKKCAMLLKRRLELEMKLSQMRNESSIKKKRLQDVKSKLRDLGIKKGGPREIITADNLEEYTKETNEIKDKVKKFKEMSDWYNSLRGVMEELTGIKLLSVSDEKNTNAIVLKIQLLGMHEIEVRLVEGKERQKDNNLCVESARFISKISFECVPDGNFKSLQLSIQDLDDIVGVCVRKGPVEDLRFLLRETMSRISAMTARIKELSLLRSNFVTKIGKIQTLTNSFGGGDQEVVCSIEEGITVVLRLTPDCPNVGGSVYVDQIVGVGGWETKILHEVREKLNRMRFRRPIEIMNELKDEICRLREENELIIPGTPSIPGINKMKN